MPVRRDEKGLFALRFTRDGDLVAATASTELGRVPEGAPGRAKSEYGRRQLMNSFKG
jgi:hypothetical protein